MEKVHEEPGLEVYFAPDDNDVIESILRMLRRRKSTLDEILRSLKNRYGFFGESRLRKIMRELVDKGYVREKYEGKTKYYWATI